MYVRTKENRYSGGYSGTVIAVAIAGVRSYADRVPRSAIAVTTVDNSYFLCYGSKLKHSKKIIGLFECVNI